MTDPISTIQAGADAATFIEDVGFLCGLVLVGPDGSRYEALAQSTIESARSLLNALREAREAVAYMEATGMLRMLDAKLPHDDESGRCPVCDLRRALSTESENPDV